ncbi:MAG TPA: TIGR03620 family F420-dependent LLM class oxidoreductase [Gaiellaceae bacterium]|nr:TIGR03620 family F420-dependent LLM class oxidoreductase [Gaiellaceae bacterium]
MALGRVGVWVGRLGVLPAREEAAAARELERLGYGALWYGEGPFNREAFAHAALLLAATERVAVASGIASIWLREPVSARNGALALAEAHPGRFVLGLGVSHAPLVERIGREYRRPLAAMRTYLSEMDAAGEYRAAAPAEPAPVVLAALGPLMLELSRDAADGAHPYLTTPEHTRRAREILGAGKLLAPEQAFALETDPARARAVGREHVGRYLELPNYRNNWLRLGLDVEDVDGLVDALVAWGDEAAVRARVEEHLAAGADHVCVQAIGEDPLGDLRRLALLLL